VPAWPEAQVARRAGARVAEARGLALHFPSPHEPDDACPHFWERERASVCPTCGKQFLPEPVGTGPTCEACLGRAQRQRELVEDRPGRQGTLFFVVVAEGAPQSRMSLLLGHAHAGLVTELGERLAARQPPAAPSVHLDATLTDDEVGALVAWCERTIDERLAAYQPRPELPEWVSAPLTFRWRDEERTVQQRMNEAGEAIATLLAFLTFFSAGRAPASLQVIGNAGVSERDVAVLALAAVRGARCTSGDLRTAFPVLAPEAIEATLAGLERRGFLTRDGEHLHLLLKGYVVSTAGPSA